MVWYWAKKLVQTAVKTPGVGGLQCTCASSSESTLQHAALSHDFAAIEPSCSEDVGTLFISPLKSMLCPKQVVRSLNTESS